MSMSVFGSPILSTAPVAGIAEPHQSTVAGILRAVGQGLFTAAEADLLIDRIRSITLPLPSPGEDGIAPQSAVTPQAPALNSPDGTVS